MVCKRPVTYQVRLDKIWPITKQSTVKLLKRFPGASIFTRSSIPSAPGDEWDIMLCNTGALGNTFAERASINKNKNVMEVVCSFHCMDLTVPVCRVKQCINWHMYRGHITYLIFFLIYKVIISLLRYNLHTRINMWKYLSLPFLQLDTTAFIQYITFLISTEWA